MRWPLAKGRSHFSPHKAVSGRHASLFTYFWNWICCWCRGLATPKVFDSATLRNIISPHSCVHLSTVQVEELPLAVFHVIFPFTLISIFISWQILLLLQSSVHRQVHNQVCYPLIYHIWLEILTEDIAWLQEGDLNLRNRAHIMMKKDNLTWFNLLWF